MRRKWVQTGLMKVMRIPDCVPELKRLKREGKLSQWRRRKIFQSSMREPTRIIYEIVLSSRNRHCEKKKGNMCDFKNEWFFYGIRRRSFIISLYDLNIVGSSITLIKSSKHKIIFVLIFRIKYRGKIYRNYFSLCQ